MSRTLTLEDLENMWIDKVESRSIDKIGADGEKFFDSETLFHMRKHFLDDWAEDGDHLPGFFFLRDWRGQGSESIKKRRQKLVRQVFNPLPGQKPKDFRPKVDIQNDGYHKDVKEKFDAAFAGSYAAAYLNRTDGAEIYEMLRKTAWHVYNYQVYNGTEDVNDALKATFSLMFGDTYLERNGGINNPNGLGLWHDKEKMGKYGLTASDLEEYKINTWFQLTKEEVSGKKGKLYLGKNIDDSLPLHQVVQHIINGGGSVWWAIINDTETGDYRVVMAQKTPEEADLEIAAKNMAQDFSSVPGIKILDNAYIDDGSGKRAITITPDQYMRGIAEFIAMDHLHQHMDLADSPLGDKGMISQLLGKLNIAPPSFVGNDPSAFNTTINDIKQAMAKAGWISPGPDISRERVKHYVENFGPGTDHYKSTPKAWSLWDTGWGTDWSDPGKLEMDLVWMPIWNYIQELEGKGPPGTKASQDEVLDIYKMRRQEMFKGPSDPAIYDTFSAYHLYMTVPIEQDRPPDDIMYTDDNQMIISGPGGIDQSEIETR